MAAGCSSNQSAATSDGPSTAAAAATPVRETSGGSYHVTYTSRPSPIPLNKVFQLEVRVCTDDAMTTPARDVTVTADAAMPHHHHGMNLVPRTEKLSDGVFRVTGMLFHMPGYWEIYVDVKPTGAAAAERARFEVEL